ncbi:YsnF/AvaK domain-containing protein [Sporosarcina sp. E16_8]|uniref:YsnF/AvaK domain-containing protein n=1 Tax=Sporosarcina sp. E16_8 TaxID=2789295 RepID=UPI001A91D423|nr:YsnF/AvaK domain-containing protein [Sporosarcina sp. E16_8]MBO0589470.1 general stress protein [Sporosarcina sp. E16_8]
MADKKFVGTFQNETEILNKIDQLKIQGYSDNDIYIVTNNTDTLSIVRGETDVDLRTPEGNWMDKFIAFLSGDEPVKGAFTNMGFTAEESNRHFDEVKAGGILLYVDREYGDFYANPRPEFQTGYTDPNIGSNLVVDDYDNTNIAMDAEREERYQAVETNITKHVVEDTQTVEAPITREEVHIERRAVTQETATDELFDHSEDIHIPAMEERIEATKRPVLSEEIIVGKREIHDTETASEPMETNRFEHNELNDNPLGRNRF